MSICRHCGHVVRHGMLPVPDDCPVCKQPLRYTNRTDGRNLLKRFHAQRKALLAYPPPPTEE